MNSGCAVWLTIRVGPVVRDLARADENLTEYTIKTVYVGLVI